LQGTNGSGLTIEATGGTLTLGNSGQTTTLQGTQVNITANSTNPITFNVNGSEAARFTTAGQFIIATTSAFSNAALTMHGTTSASVGVAGIFQDLVINPSVSNTYQFGNRSITKVDPQGGASTSAIGTLLRVIDNSTASNTVRALEVQAYSGTNIAGVNTGIISFGRTFGIQGISTGQAGDTLVPAGVYAEIQHPTQGNALRAYSATTTSGSLVQFYQEASAFTGAGLLMNFGNNSGSFTGRFIDARLADTTQFMFNASGSLAIGTTSLTGLGFAASLGLNVAGGLTQIQIASQSSQWLCHNGSDGSATQSVVITDCYAGAGDIAEWYETKAEVEPGDVVVMTNEVFEYTGGGSATTLRTAILDKSATSYQPGLVGIVSTAPFQVFGEDIKEGAQNPQPVALAGRVPVKVNLENGPINAGDALAASSIPGEAMRASKASWVVGFALEPLDMEAQGTTSKVMAFLKTGWWVPSDDQLLQESNVSDSLNTQGFDPDKKYVFKSIETGQLTVGSQEKPTGITLFDTKTGEPYCVFVEGGNMRNIPGRCDTIEWTPTPSGASSQPPAEEPPIEEEPPAEEPPVEEEQPVEETPPAEEPLIEEPPVEEIPPAEELPITEEPPVEESPTEEPPPVEEPPVEEQPLVEETPVEEPPTEESPPEEVVVDEPAPEPVSENAPPEENTETTVSDSGSEAPTS
jgi:hypothetical protein